MALRLTQDHRMLPGIYIPVNELDLAYTRNWLYFFVFSPNSGTYRLGNVTFSDVLNASQKQLTRGVP